MIFRLFIIYFFLMAYGQAYSACLGTEPVKAAKTLYDKHYNFASNPPQKNIGILTPRLKWLFELNYKCSQGGICIFDTDMWTNTQDGVVGDPKVFKLTDQNGNDATVVMNYEFYLSDKDHRPQSVTIDLHRPMKGGCWVVSDFTRSDGLSVLYALEHAFDPPKPIANQRGKVPH